ncbi:hypothetical protein [Caulobacter endophyticus]|uniref:hypothetical protein n=1 Tax=Caulobacter endophyticus TaxID=2172652 RepID=UPI002410A55A|nr:hypothetical protein [Caulobacter endophyticus]MDG2528272.1 hypothetical protein [Caulobacter endophyticus]
MTVAPHRRFLDYLEEHHHSALELLVKGRPAPDLALQDACDVVYTLELIGQTGLIGPDGAQAFWDHARRWRLAGGLNAAAPDAPSANVHLTAYALGALRLLLSHDLPVARPLFAVDGWKISDLLDADARPKWPKKWSHHSWRVSHWIGGSASIVLSLWVLDPAGAERRGVPAVDSVLKAADSLIDPRTGLLKCYKSDLVQKGFRALYRLRHDPDAGDVGGIVHLHWVNYATGRLPYKAAAPLFERSVAVSHNQPFIESAPYCLDFDIVQIIRTSAAGPDLPDQQKARAAAFIDDIARFFETRLNGGYALHKLPGALATQHEAALILGQAELAPLGIAPIDIIKRAGWI